MSIDLDAIQAIIQPLIDAKREYPKTQFRPEAEAAMALLAYARDLEARIERGLELHVAEGNGNCVACWDFSNDTDVKYPCPTIAALTVTEDRA